MAVVLFIYSNNISGNVSTLCRSSDKNFLGACLDVFASARAINKDPSSLNISSFVKFTILYWWQQVLVLIYVKIN